jgi:endonuclease IV
MDPLTLMMIGTAVSAGGTILGGIGAQQEAQLNAFQMQTQKKENQVTAMQQARARREEYDLATSANLAAFAAQGRDIGADRSVEAFLRRQEEIVGQDLGRIARQTRAEDLRADMMAMAEKRRGRNALYSSLFSAVGTMAEAGYQYQKVKIPTTGKRLGGGGK